MSPWFVYNMISTSDNDRIDVSRNEKSYKYTDIFNIKEKVRTYAEVFYLI